MSGIRPSGLHVNKPALFVFLGLLVLLVLAYRFMWATNPNPLDVKGNSLPEGAKDSEGLKGSNSRQTSPGQSKQNVWNLVGMLEPPALNEEAKKKLARKAEMFDINVSGTKIKIYIQQVINNEVKAIRDILFLHGARFSSADWQNISALDEVANWGYRAIAVDLPGKGKSTTKLEGSLTKQFLPGLIQTLEMSRPVIIAPSMSGQYALPYLFEEPEKSTERATAFVPVTPVGTTGFVNAFPKSQIPTLIVFGSKDPSGRRVLQDLQTLPKSIVAEIPEAGHACYLDQPKSFFKYLHAFLKEVTKKS